MFTLANTKETNFSGRGKSLSKGTKTQKFKCVASKNARNGIASLLVMSAW